IKRMVFSEITKKAILEALSQTRELDMNLVQAQETRRILDRLYGYTLSPLLWKKIRRGLSAGRVQSVAVRVLVARELERLAFKSGTYWDLAAQMEKAPHAQFKAQLHSVGGKRIATGKDFDEHTGQIAAGVDVLLLAEQPARDLQQRLKSEPWTVTKIEQRDQTRRPAPPFTTSTLQQEANRKLNLGARQTMQVAQRLYEEGIITYMRTDSVNLSQEALNAARKRITGDYGDKFLSPQARQFSNKTKNAQEAHEAIRPAGDQMQTASELGLSGVESRLYDMIWKRTIASQMAEAQLRFDTVTITAGEAEFRAVGRHVVFPGFFRAYVEGGDDPEAAHEDEDAALPPLAEGDVLQCRDIAADSHETKPPARYTEASLVRKLEQEGIGRPSTYASIISTIQDRGYVRKAGNQLVPTFTAMAVNRLLERYFPKLVDLAFTAEMEQDLDDISNGEEDQVPYLARFYSGQEGLEEQVKVHESEIDPRDACTLQLGNLNANVRVGKFGPYLEKQENGETLTASLPDDVAPAEINDELAEKLFHLKKEGPKALGMHPEQGVPVYVLVGPYGPYVQLGDVTDETPKPKRSSIPRNYDPSSVDLNIALKLLELPRRIGHHPVDNKVVNVGFGRFGPYILHDKKYGNFDKKSHTFETADGRVVDVLNVDMDAALEMLAKSKSRGAAPPLKDLGVHPEDQQPVGVYDGKYGPYIKHNKTYANVPKDREPASVTLEEALVWLAERVAKGGKGKKGAKKSTAKKASKSTIAKKAPARKKSTKKGATKTSAARKKKKTNADDFDE
ncbi:MAG: type I DNA topoisomerase, partial [Planctomycetaceae bacterium]